MNVYRSNELILEGSVVAIGAFDGVHKGHQTVIQKTVELSRLLKVPSVVYTFDPPPRVYFQRVQKLTNIFEKISKIKTFEVENIIVATFDNEYVNKSANSFIIELQKLNPLTIIVGEDFRFGYKRHGDIELLRKYFNVKTVAPVCCNDGVRISSTRIRKLMNEGKTENILSLLI